MVSSEQHRETGNNRISDRLPPEAAELPAHLAELRDFAQYYLKTRIDELAVKGRRVGTWAAVGLAGAVVALGAAIAFVTLVFLGIGLGFAALTGMLWLGLLISGGLGLIVLILPAVVALRVIERKAARQRKESYERAKQAQRERHGHDIAAAAGRQVRTSGR